MAVNFTYTPGAGNYVQIEDIPAYYTAPMTVCWWMRLEANQTVGGGGWILPISRIGSNAHWYAWAWQLWWSGTNNIPTFYVIDGADVWHSVSTNTFPAIGVWAHYTLTIAPALTSYVNGVFQQQDNGLTSLNTSTTPGQGVRIGTDGNDYSQFVGQIDDFRIYNRVISTNEMSTIVNCRGTDNIVYGLVGRWLFNEQSPNVSLGVTGSVRDLTGKNNGNPINTSNYYSSNIVEHKKRIS